MTTTPSEHRVRVFTTPTCSWCHKLKTYLGDKQVPFTEIDISRDHEAARDMVLRSGQIGVPVAEIDGHIVVGFDRPRIDSLLGLTAGA